LGQYGSNTSDDAAMDVYVSEVVSESLGRVNREMGDMAKLALIGSCAGREASGKPVIVVTLARVAARPSPSSEG
jgi:hypothetical protein